MAPMRARDVFLGTIGVVGAFGCITSLATLGGVFNSKPVFRMTIGLGCSAPIVPLMMRWSLKYWNKTTFPKFAELIIGMWIVVWYLVAATMLIVAINVENSDLTNRYGFYIPAGLAFIAGVTYIVDLCVTTKNKKNK